ncbi:MAG: c-type cytochrome [Deltaproteobacteria bacterium]|nr:c-type cytochrome [Deltaproteobacteria bacterium]
MRIPLSESSSTPLSAPSAAPLRRRAAIAFAALSIACTGPDAALDARAADAHAPDAKALYAEHCASCHGVRRYGGYAPPLIPNTLSRKSDEELTQAIREGLPNTQMPPFAAKFDRAALPGLVALLREPVGDIRWSLEDIAASRVEEPMAAGAIPPEISRENLTLVVERGAGAVVVLDGDTLKELDRFAVGGRIHGGVKFDLGFHRALAATRDGTVVDYDLDRGALRTRVKAGVNTRNIAVSRKGDFVAATNQLPPGLVLFDGRLRPLRILPLDGQPSGVYQLPGRDRFIMTLRDRPLLYTISQPELEVKTRELPEPFEDFVFVPGTRRLVASSRGGSRLLLYDWEKHEVLASLPTQGLPHLFSACFFSQGEKLYAAFNHMGAARLSIIEMERFQVVKDIPLVGSGYFARTHSGTPYLWIDTNSEEIQLVDKATLEPLTRTLRPQEGKKAMHVEFTADGSRALVSIWHPEGAVVVYDSATLEEVARIPYAMPVGKYNAGNKTRSLR